MTNSYSTFKDFLFYALPWRARIIIASIYSIMNKLFDIMPEILIGFAVDLVIKQQDSFIASLGFTNPKSQITILAIVTFFIWVFESLFQYLHSITWRGIAQSVEHDIRLDAYNHIQHLDLDWHENQRIGNITAILNDDVNQLERFLDSGINDILQLVVSTCTIGAVFFYISPIIALVSIIPVPIIIGIAFYFQKNLSPRYIAVREAVGRISSAIFNNLNGIITIKSFTSEGNEYNRIDKLSSEYRESNNNAIKLSSAFVPVIRIGVLSGFLATLIIGSFMTMNGVIAVGSFSVLVFLTQRFLWPFTTLGQTIDQFERSMASTGRILSLLKLKKSIKENDDSKELRNPQEDIIFENVQFNYPNNSSVFEKFSLKIPSGKTIGVVGQTGSGKTTLIKLLLRLYDIQNGSICIGGQDLKNLSLYSLRENIGFVNQELHLFEGSIKENISYPFLPDNFEKIKKASETSHALEFIENLPDGFETIIGEKGQRLSVGQKQRLTIARAIYKNPPILIFDEATSSVDNETEQLIQHALENIAKDRTTIIIAHRLSTIRNSDKIIVLDKGNIVESGTHNELVNLDGIYNHLWQIQLGNKN
jgi:ATP-binding cassette, subfamily B, bacterial